MRFASRKRAYLALTLAASSSLAATAQNSHRTLTLSLWGGAAVTHPAAGTGTPAAAGVRVSWWVTQWLLLDAVGGRVFETSTTQLWVGPRLRKAMRPLSASVGLKLGPSFVGGETRFGLSPEVGVDLAVGRVSFSLGYAVDIPFGVPDYTHRIFIAVGLRL